MSQAAGSAYGQARARIVAAAPDGDADLKRVPPAARLEIVFRALSEEMSPLVVGAVLWPAMSVVAELRYGRVVAAQLADLALRGHLWMSYGGTHVGPPGLMASRRPDAPDDTAPEEKLLLDVVFGAAPSVRLAGRMDGRAWDGLSAEIHRRAAELGLGGRRLDRYRLLRLLQRLRRWMREYSTTAAEADEQAWLHRAGYPYAVLFAIETGLGSWPALPEEEVFLPSLLPEACNLAINAGDTDPGRWLP